MGFSSSLSKFRFLSELYKYDAPKSAILMEYPSSNSDETIYKNTKKFIIYDPYPPPDIALLKILGPHHLMCCWGGGISVTSEIRLPEILVDHWCRIFGADVKPEWKKYDRKENYITLFPHEYLSADQQEIDPAIMYKLHSKEIIGKINCPQAGILDSISSPCILKLSHGYAGIGNFFIHNDDDALKAKKYIDKHWSNATVIINEIITDIVGDYCVQFYLDKNGKLHWLGFTEQIFNDDMRWAGGTFSFKKQDKFYPEFVNIAKPVANYLHKNGYYGVVGIDILQDKNNELFLVDINPRLNGSTPFLMASRLFLEQGYNEGIYIPSISLYHNLEDLISMAEDIKNAKVVILSAYEDNKTGQTTCHISISSTSLDHCRASLACFLK